MTILNIAFPMLFLLVELPLFFWLWHSFGLRLDVFRAAWRLGRPYGLGRFIIFSAYRHWYDKRSDEPVDSDDEKLRFVQRVAVTGSFWHFYRSLSTCHYFFWFIEEADRWAEGHKAISHHLKFGATANI